MRVLVKNEDGVVLHTFEDEYDSIVAEEVEHVIDENLVEGPCRTMIIEVDER